MVITLTINFAQLTPRRFDLQRHYSPECEVTHQSLTKGAVKRDPMYLHYFFFLRIMQTKDPVCSLKQFCTWLLFCGYVKSLSLKLKSSNSRCCVYQYSYCEESTFHAGLDTRQYWYFSWYQVNASTSSHIQVERSPVQWTMETKLLLVLILCP